MKLKQYCIVWYCVNCSLSGQLVEAQSKLSQVTMELDATQRQQQGLNPTTDLEGSNESSQSDENGEIKQKCRFGICFNCCLFVYFQLIKSML